MQNDIKKQQVNITSDDRVLIGDLAVPGHATGLVLFAHGSGSSRHSRRNRAVAEVLNHAGLATLLFDLLSEQEGAIDDQTRELRFDMELLARRLIGAMEWMESQEGHDRLPMGLFGASTGGGAALMAAARRPHLVQAVVSRGGRPELAGRDLTAVRAPTLLIVGGADAPVITLNEEAKDQMQAPVELSIVEGASHLFEEPGALEAVAIQASGFFGDHLKLAGIHS